MAKLFIVPTPIGNLGDITLRALNILKEVDLIAAEDTRTSSILLRHHGIAKPLTSMHAFNEHKKVEELLEKIETEGLSIAVISDAGTPGISDPGFLIVREGIKKNIPIEVLPGPTAFVPALIASGLPCDRFVFEGFLPQKKGRKTRLEFLASEIRTMIFYESPFRLLKTLKEFSAVFGPERIVSVSREISKIHEEHIRGTLAEVHLHYSSATVKGEIVIVLAGKE